ncbi:Metallo-hydrolase/oxidoreductase [Westerdykella ornata]|uniref:Metallo-hydrolase/oxidoreductase n=1 Tax=Westerdykella ornata TaxID=318751 RepID=A0A6A6JQG7_WESOR|nr:Metallo-hydrolase/oxidoreductase [Westerdykella ornata]KAF2278363.1 Metallo-hydrolase/oxidoreductase [Westerdykella ornata]
MTNPLLPLNTALRKSTSRLCTSGVWPSPSIISPKYSYSCRQTRAAHSHSPFAPRLVQRTASFRTSSNSAARNVLASSSGIKNTVIPYRNSQSSTSIGRAAYSYVANPPQEPLIQNVFEDVTGTWQYVVVDPETKAAATIDAVLDYDPVTLAVDTRTADGLLALIDQHGYKVQWILETHAHADHLSAAAYLQDRLAEKQGERPPIGIGKRIGQVQQLFGRRYGVPSEEYEDVFAKLFDDDEVFEIGNLKAKAMHLPGHTPDHLGYKIGDNVFCGDTIFHVDIGTARCDFPGGSASDLWDSARRLLSLPDHVKIWMGHDYPPGNRRKPVACLTVKEHRELNKHLKNGITRDEFLTMRREKDYILKEPRLLHQSLQINIRAGHLPEPTEAGLQLLHTPIKLPGTISTRPGKTAEK